MKTEAHAHTRIKQHHWKVTKTKQILISNKCQIQDKNIKNKDQKNHLVLNISHLFLNYLYSCDQKAKLLTGQSLLIVWKQK